MGKWAAPSKGTWASGNKSWDDWTQSKAPPLEHSFEVDPDDHCETPPEAYGDIVNALEFIANALNKSKHSLKIYDPYFCAGAVVRNLTQRGFPDVYNKNEDFYAAIEAQTTPVYDVLVTNPPYSQDHIEKLLRFCVNSGKPWFMLVPNFVYVNEYYDKITQAASAKPFFLVPTKRYEYYSPAGCRSERESKTSPFLSCWFADLQPAMNGPYIRSWRQAALAAPPSQVSSWPVLAGHRSQLPHSMRAQYDPSRKRLRKKQREAFTRKRRRQPRYKHVPHRAKP